jgi:hypothetical protein
VSEGGNEEAAEYRTLDAPTQQLPALIPAMAHVPPDASAPGPGLARRWRWPLLTLAAAALASVPIALFATSDGSHPPQGRVLPPQWPPAAQAGPSPSPSPSLATPSPSEVPVAPPPPPPVQEAPRRVTPSASPTTPAVLSYEAEAPGNRLRGRAAPRELASASGGTVVGWVGEDRRNTVAFTGVMVVTAGRHRVTIYYASQERRAAAIEVNGRFAGVLDFLPTGGWDTVGSMTVTLTMGAGANTIEFGNRYDWAPDFDRIVLSG